MSKILEMREQRAALIKNMRSILDKAEAEKRDINTEEQESYSKLETEHNALKAKIEKEESLSRAERELSEVVETRAHTVSGAKVSDEQRAKIFDKYLKHGMAALTSDEARDLAQGAQTTGGALVPTEQFLNELLKFRNDAVILRQRARVIRVTGAQSLGIPSLDADPADADWTTEVATGSADTAMAFGKRTLIPQALAKRVKISNTLLNNSAIPAEQIVRERLGYKFAITEEKAYMTGTGANRPLGLFTASADGIDTSRDVSTDNLATAPTFDGLKNCKYTLKPQYRQNAVWVFHSSVLKVIEKIKDGEGRYVWEPSVQANQPDTLFGYPVIESLYAPSTLTTGLYVGLLGDLSYFWIAESVQFMVQRLNELYAESNQVGFIGRMEIDAMPVLAEAFVRVKLA